MRRVRRRRSLSRGRGDAAGPASRVSCVVSAIYGRQFEPPGDVVSRNTPCALRPDGLQPRREDDAVALNSVARQCAGILTNAHAHRRVRRED